MRFTLACIAAAAFPYTIVTAARSASAAGQPLDASDDSGSPNDVTSTRINEANLATRVALDVQTLRDTRPGNGLQQAARGLVGIGCGKRCPSRYPARIDKVIQPKKKRKLFLRELASLRRTRN